MLKYAIVTCIFEAIGLSVDAGASLSSFEDLLCYARRMYCRGKGVSEDNPDIEKIWPKDWRQARQYLVDSGYEDAKEYLICLNGSHEQHWDIMMSSTQKCRYCGEAGTIKYYYLGLKAKVTQWTANPEMCSKMTAHLSEREHWMNGRDCGWDMQHEVWDGTRFSGLAWFWDPDKAWCLPARCVREECRNIMSAADILQAPGQQNGMRELYCDQCCTRFLHQCKYANGDPRNVAHISCGYTRPFAQRVPRGNGLGWV